AVVDQLAADLAHVGGRYACGDVLERQTQIVDPAPLVRLPQCFFLDQVVPGYLRLVAGAQWPRDLVVTQLDVQHEILDDSLETLSGRMDGGQHFFRILPLEVIEILQQDLRKTQYTRERRSQLMGECEQDAGAKRLDFGLEAVAESAEMR